MTMGKERKALIRGFDNEDGFLDLYARTLRVLEMVSQMTSSADEVKHGTPTELRKKQL